MAEDDPREGNPMGKCVSENTLDMASSGFTRYNILQNNSVENLRHSIVVDDEYESNESTDSSSQVGENGSSKDTVNSDDFYAADKNKKFDSLDELHDTFTENGNQLTEVVSVDSVGANYSVNIVSKAQVYRHVKNSKVRFKKDGKMRSNFGDLNFIPRKTIFDEEIYFGSKFFGLFVAIWICIFFFGLDVVCGYVINHGNLWKSEIVQLMIKDIWKVGCTDLLMYLSMYLSVIIQFLIKSKVIEWKHTGYTLQIFYELSLLFLPSVFATYMDFPWIAQIFLMLHSCVMLMKVHSYGFFNGYLWEIKKELEFSKKVVKRGIFHDEKTKTALQNSIKFCESEIGCQDFPNNINLFNFFEYSMFPVLVYQTKYPRNESIRGDYLIKKVLGIFGVILLMIAIAQQKLYPIVMKCLELQQTTSFEYRLRIYPFILIETIPPFLTVYLLVFYLIWELILNAIAEISMFADREFYRYWWNSVDWNEYARDWNVPVHKFLLRHVYHSSISAFHVNKTMATLLTFFLSSIIHELAMFVIFRKIRFYLLMLQMNQLSLVHLSKTKWMKDRFVLGNCIFWFGVVFGPSLMCTMYLVF